MTAASPTSAGDDSDSESAESDSCRRDSVGKNEAKDSVPPLKRVNALNPSSLFSCGKSADANKFNEIRGSTFCGAKKRGVVVAPRALSRNVRSISNDGRNGRKRRQSTMFPVSRAIAQRIFPRVVAPPSLPWGPLHSNSLFTCTRFSQGHEGRWVGVSHISSNDHVYPP